MTSIFVRCATISALAALSFTACSSPPAALKTCAANNGDCDANTTCTEASSAVVCTCRTGFTGDGQSCVAVSGNACDATPPPCGDAVAGACTSTPGSFTCQCNAGFQNTGGVDTGACTDINECATNNGGCDPNAICANTVGSFTCTCDMSRGYQGSGTTCTLNPCLLNNGGCGTGNAWQTAPVTVF